MSDSIKIIANVGGISVTLNNNIANVGGLNQIPPLPAAQVGSLGAAALVTTPVPHGLAGTEILGVFWSGGQRLGCTVTVVSPTTFTLAAGVGTTLPSGSPVVPLTFSVATLLPDCMFNAATMLGFVITCDQQAAVQFWNDMVGESISLPGVVETTLSIPAGGGTAWCVGMGVSPIAADPITSATAYNAGTTIANLKIGVSLPT